MTEFLTIQMTQRQPVRSDHHSKYKIRKIKKENKEESIRGDVKKSTTKKKESIRKRREK